MESISPINNIIPQTQSFNIYPTNKDKKDFTIEESKSTEEKKPFFEIVRPNKNESNNVKQEEIDLVKYIEKVDQYLAKYNKEVIDKFKESELKQKDFNPEAPFEVNNKNYKEYINNNLSEQLDNLISSFKEFIKLRSDLTIYQSKRNDLLQASAKGVDIQESLISNYDSKINEITKKIGSTNSKEYIFDNSNAKNIVSLAENLTNNIKNNLLNNESLDKINNDYKINKNNISNTLTTTHTLLESIEKIKNS